ncbi:hypothetical protein C5167_005621 [Papaver somniferum]|uniref:Uncharacterized protein n=1 Tax=Papaver somniferum TaxID=3469 RepID=A0A4Y7JCR3_PAPSO|nr:hypothetical protein C5167_005621 [Papaver somniferum]
MAYSAGSALKTISSSLKPVANNSQLPKLLSFSSQIVKFPTTHQAHTTLKQTKSITTTPRSFFCKRDKSEPTSAKKESPAPVPTIKKDDSASLALTFEVLLKDLSTCGWVLPTGD